MPHTSFCHNDTPTPQTPTLIVYFPALHSSNLQANCTEENRHTKHTMRVGIPKVRTQRATSYQQQG